MAACAAATQGVQVHELQAVCHSGALAGLGTCGPPTRKSTKTGALPCLHVHGIRVVASMALPACSPPMYKSMKVVALPNIHIAMPLVGLIIRGWRAGLHQQTATLYTLLLQRAASRGGSRRHCNAR